MGAIEDIDKAARNSMQLSIELVALFGETLSKLFNDLATASQRASKDLQNQLRRTTYGALTDATVAGEQLQGQAEQLTTQAQVTFTETRDQVLQGLQLPTLASITHMQAQLDRLDKDVSVLEMGEILPNYPTLHA